MAAGVRVKLNAVGTGETRGVVTAFRVALTQWGAGTSKLAKGATAAATIVFHAKFIERVREKEESVSEYARLSGQLRREASSGRLVFTLPSGGDFEYVEPVAPSRLRAELRVEFDGQQFEGVSGFAGGNPRFVLPEYPEGALFLELHPVLTLDGAVEAELDASAALDIPTELVPYLVVLLDETDQPLSGVELAVTAGAHRERLSTDSDGRVKFTVPRISDAVVSVSDAEAWHARFEHLGPGERRATPFPGDVKLVTPRRLLEGVALASRQETRLMVVARLGLKYPSASTAWQGLELASDGPFELKLEREDKVTAVHARADGTSRQLRVVKKVQEPGSSTSTFDWLKAALDELHDALTDGDFERVFQTLEAIPVTAPGKRTPHLSATPAETSALAAARVEVAALGEVQPPFVEGQQV